MMYRSLFRLMSVLTALVALATLARPASAAIAIDDAAFQRIWQRQDRAVAEQASARSWTWGPGPFAPSLQEPFLDGPQGRRHVLYFDKSRMEINDPSGDRSSQWYVTNGLLPIELMTGQLQLGYHQFEQRAPAAIGAIGDPGNFPTYADLGRLYQSPGPGAADLGQPAAALLNPDRTIGRFDAFAGDPATILRQGDNNHSVPQAFVDFMQQRGLVYAAGRYTQAPVYDPLFVFGLPVTQPYWVMAKVGGVERPILFQAFERRILTYNPANEPAFQVEMGNVGQHYYQWRYARPLGGHISWTTSSRFVASIAILDPTGAPATLVMRSPCCPALSWSPDGQRVAFNGYGSLVNIYVMARDGSGITQLTDDEPGQRSNDGPSWSPDSKQIVYASTSDGGRELYRMQADGSQKTRLTNTPEEEASPAWSPDGRQIAFLSGTEGNRLLEVINADGSGRRRLTDATLQLDGDALPQWSPDSGTIALIAGPTDAKRLYLVQADGSGAAALLPDTVSSDPPAWSPDGRRIAFTLERNGSAEVGVVNRDGTGLVQLTSDGKQNRAPAWSPDGRRLAFLSDMSGADDVYAMDDDGANVLRLTRNEVCTVCGPGVGLYELHWLP